MEGHFPIPDSDVLVVLGTQMFESPDTLESKVRRATALFDSESAPLIVFSGGKKVRGYDVPEAKLMRQLAIERGVPESATIAEPYSRDLLGSVYFSRLMLDEINAPYGNVDIITEGYNGTFIDFAFRKVFPSETGIGISALRSENSLRQIYNQMLDIALGAGYAAGLALLPQGDMPAIRTALMMMPRYYSLDFNLLQTAA